MLDLPEDLSLSAEEFPVASGLYVPEPAELQRFRAAVDAEASGADLAEIVAALRAANHQITAHDLLELLRHKGIAMTKTWPVGAWLGTREAKDRVVKALRAAGPLNEWLNRHVR